MRRMYVCFYAHLWTHWSDQKETKFLRWKPCGQGFFFLWPIACGSGDEIGGNKILLWQYVNASICEKYRIVLNLFLLLSYIVMFCISCKKILPFWHAKKISFSTRKNLVLFVRIADTFSNNYKYIWNGTKMHSLGYTVVSIGCNQGIILLKENPLLAISERQS